MNNAIATIVASGLAVFALAGCGPDPVIGTWSYTGTNASMVTMPTTSSMTTSSTGTLTITAATTSGNYTYTFQDAGSSDQCLLTGTLAGSVLTFLPNQACMFTANGTTISATITSGTATLAGGARSPQTIHVAYTFIGSLSGVAFSGTGIEDFTATISAM